MSLREFAEDMHLSPFRGTSFSKGELGDILSALGAFELVDAKALGSLFRFFCFSENDERAKSESRIRCSDVQAFLNIEGFART